MQNQWKRILWFICLLAAAACAPRVTQGSTAIQTVLAENGFQPMQWIVPAGEVIRLSLKNSTAQTHSWTLLERFPKHDAAPTDPLPQALIRFEIEPGAEQTVAFTAPLAPGEYRVLCDMHRQDNEALLGILVVENNP